MGLDDESLPLLLAIDLEYAFTEVIKKYSDELYNSAFRWVANHQKAEDIVQETFTRAYIALGGYNTDRVRSLHLRNWLYTILHNLCRNDLRQGKNQEIIASSLESDPFVFQPINEQELPEYIAIDSERRSETEDLVMKLPNPYRDAIYLRYFVDWSYQEIANHFHAPEGTAKSYVFRGKKLLRELITTLEDGEQ